MQAPRSTTLNRQSRVVRVRRLSFILLPIIAALAFLLLARTASVSASDTSLGSFESSQNPNSLLAGPRATGGPGIYEDNNANVVFENTWVRVSNGYASGGTFARSRVTYAVAKLYVSGATGFQIMTSTGPNRGIAKILVDGRDIGRWDTYSSAYKYKVLSAVYPLPNTGTHWIGIQVSGTRNAASTGNYIFMDQFAIRSAPTPTRTATALPTNTSTATRSATALPTNTFTSTPTQTASGTYYEDDDSSVSYENIWTRFSDSSASGGHYTRSDITYAIARLTLSGATSFQFQTVTGPDRGIVKVLIDGKDVGRFDTYSANTVYGVLSPSYKLPDANTHWIGIQAGDSRNAASTGYTAVLDEFIVNGGSVVPTSTPTATSTAQPTNTPTATGTARPTNTPTVTPPPSNAHMRRVNMPNFGASPVAFNQTAVFWLGRVNENTQYGDIRMGYNDSEIFINANVMDAYLWYNANTPTNTDLPTYDSVSIYLSQNGTSVTTPDSGAYRFDAEFTWWESDRARWQAAYQGNGSTWTLLSRPFTTSAGWRGDQPNNAGMDRGWTVTYHIPYAALGLSGRPAYGTLWGIAVALHNRNDAAGTPIVDQVWPENMNKSNPTTWGELHFGLTSPYTAPSALNLQTTTIKNNLNGQVVTTTNVGGYTQCGENIGNYGLAYWQQWGVQNWAGMEFLNPMNQNDIADWACYNKIYAQFPLSTIPTGKVITSAKLTMYQFGHAGTPDQNPGPSLVQIFGVDAGWTPGTINWNNAPWPTQNLDRQWAGVGECLNYINCPSVTWDVSKLVADAYKAGLPLRVIMYSSDDQISSGKYFFASEQGDWNAANRPALVVTYGAPQ